jgi:hypothetical protein
MLTLLTGLAHLRQIALSFSGNVKITFNITVTEPLRRFRDGFLAKSTSVHPTFPVAQAMQNLRKGG